jgi:hypothetical protein
MTVPTSRYSLNIRRSFNTFFRKYFEVPNSMKGKVNYGDSSFDASPMDAWVVIGFLADLAGKKGFTMVQIDVLTLVAGRRSGGDRYGTICQQLADKVHSALHVDAMPLYDFTSNPANPTLLPGKKLVVQNSAGTFREPEEVRALTMEENLNRIVLTYRLKTLGDYAAVNSYYD